MIGIGDKMVCVCVVGGGGGDGVLTPDLPISIYVPHMPESIKIFD